jgi:hypothetical protein
LLSLSTTRCLQLRPARPVVAFKFKFDGQFFLISLSRPIQYPVTSRWTKELELDKISGVNKGFKFACIGAVETGGGQWEIEIASV